MKKISDASKGTSPFYYCIPGSENEIIDLIYAYSRVATDAWTFFLWASAVQYIFRYSLKGEPSKDLGKALTYLSWLKKSVDERP